MGLADQRSFDLPLSQEALGDAVGLSPAYVNRVLRRLADERLVAIKDQRVVINDVAALSALADFEHSYLEPLPIWEFGDAAWWAPAVATRIESRAGR